jgi:hypothetical protein
VVAAAVVLVVSSSISSSGSTSSSDLSVTLCYLKNYPPEVWAMFSIIILISSSTT